MFRTILLSSVALVLVGSSAYGETLATLSKSRLTTSIGQEDAAQLQARAAKKGGGGIYNDFATAYKDGFYWCCTGGTIAGQNSTVGLQVQQGVPFTAEASKSVTKITVAASNVSGTNSMTISLYSDKNNLPGKELASGTADNLVQLGLCCSTITATIPSTQLTKGAEYWVVLSSPDDSWESWNDSTIDQVHGHSIAYNQNNTGWTSYFATATFAVAVK